MSVYHNITELIGKTPLVKLKMAGEGINLLLKLELFNPGGSIKDRIALKMIREAEDKGELKEGGTIVEPSSGNTGIGLAMIGAALGYRVIITMPDTMSEERRKLLRAYGAELVLTPGNKGMKGAIKKAAELVEENRDYFLPDQFKNPANPGAHRWTTAEEILQDTGNRLDYFIAGVGTGGTVTGVGGVIKERLPEVEVIAVEPAGSAVLSGEEAGPHKIQGIGAGFIPEVLNTGIYDRVIKIEDEEALETARRLAREEGLLLGISCGAAAAAALKVAAELKKEGLDRDEEITMVVIAPDSGERYLSTELFEPR